LLCLVTSVVILRHKQIRLILGLSSQNS
jgi:hypothetical protein